MKKIRNILIYGVVIIVFIVLISMFHRNYNNTVKIIESEYKIKTKLVEESIYNSIKYSDAATRIAEKELNERMKEYSLIMVEKYRNHPDVLQWNLEELKQQFNGYEIYIIDRNLKVVKTTFAEDGGLDFKKFPSFSKIIEKRLKGNSFVADRADISTNTGKLNKYSYISSPDHQYLFELSVNLTQRFPELNNMDTFSVADDLIRRNPSVQNISFYKYDGKQILKVSKTRPFYSVVNDNKKEDFIKKAINSYQVQTTDVGGTRIKSNYTYKYIPYYGHQNNGEINWWTSYVIEVVYNNKDLLIEIDNRKKMLWENIGIVSLVYFTFIYLILYMFRKSEYMAYHDHLTNLPNRKLFEDNFKNKINESKKNGKKLAVLLLDLDDFKTINDTYGHITGDAVLKEFARRTKNNLGRGNVISRLGGDEFTILLSHINAENEIIDFVSKFFDQFKNPMIINGNEIKIASSIGISIYPDDDSVLEDLIKKADAAMYYAKKNKLDYVFFREQLLVDV